MSDIGAALSNEKFLFFGGLEREGRRRRLEADALLEGALPRRPQLLVDVVDERLVGAGEGLAPRAAIEALHQDVLVEELIVVLLERLDGVRRCRLRALIHHGRKLSAEGTMLHHGAAAHQRPGSHQGCTQALVIGGQGLNCLVEGGRHLEYRERLEKATKGTYTGLYSSLLPTALSS